MTPQEQEGFIPSMEREPTTEEQAIIDSRELKATRERLRRLYAGESQWDVYGGARERASILSKDEERLSRAYVSEYPADDDDLCDQEYLESLKFKFVDDDCLRLEITTSGLYVNVTIDREGGAKTLSLGWESCYQTPGRVGMVYLIEDEPTKGRVRKLLEALS